MTKKIELLIECKSCDGTGLYSGMGESKNTAVICHKCKGTGKHKYTFEYNEFTGLKKRTDIKRVYLKNYGYKIGTGKITFEGIGKINMDKEGVSYKAFLAGKKPKHIENLVCPFLADQGACHDIKGFVDRCNSFNNGWLNYIPDCKNKENKKECWKLFNKKLTNQ